MLGLGNGTFFWGLITFFFFVIYFMMLFNVIGDLFRDKSMSGAGKVFWILFLLIIPLFSLLIYVIVRGGGMAERALEAQKDMQAQMDAYVKQTAAGADPAEQIAKAKKLLDDGAISQQEFDDLKKKAMA